MLIETFSDGKQGTSRSYCRKISEADYQLGVNALRKGATPRPPVVAQHLWIARLRTAWIFRSRGLMDVVPQ
jgi:hypothetical protein